MDEYLGKYDKSIISIQKMNDVLKESWADNVGVSYYVINDNIISYCKKNVVNIAETEKILTMINKNYDKESIEDDVNKLILKANEVLR